MGKILGLILVIAVCGLAAGAMSGQTATPVVSGDYAGTLGPLHLVVHVLTDAAGKLRHAICSEEQDGRAHEDRDLHWVSEHTCVPFLELRGLSYRARAALSRSRASARATSSARAGAVPSGAREALARST